MNEEKKDGFNGNDEDGISIRDIFRIIGKKIWYVLAATLVVTLAAVLVFMFAINPSKQHQSMSFRIDYPMSDDGKYPDGSVFDYRDIVSRRVIEAAKNHPDYKEEFSDIDVDKVIRGGGISISAQTTSDEPNASHIYTVSLKSSYFKGVNAENFIFALTEAFNTFVEDKAGSLNYSLDREIFEHASFKDQLVLLTEQKENIMRQYDNWIKEYSAGHVVQGRSLGGYRMEVVTMLADNVKAPIENDLSFNGYEYFNGSVTEDEVRTRVKQLYAELEFDRAILEELRSYYTDVSTQSQSREIAPYAADDNSDSSESGGSTIIIAGGDSNLSQRIAYYTERATTIDHQIVYLTDGLNIKNEMSEKNLTADEVIEAHDFSDMVNKIKDFGNKLTEQFNILNAKANTLKSVICAIYNRDTILTFNSQRASSEGGTSLVIVAVGVLVVSFLVCALIAFFVGQKNLKSKKKEKTVKEENSKNE